MSTTVRRTLERKKKKWAAIRASRPPEIEGFWQTTYFCTQSNSFVKVRRRTRVKHYHVWWPPVDHPAWHIEKGAY